MTCANGLVKGRNIVLGFLHDKPTLFMDEGKGTKLVKRLKQVSTISIQYHEGWVAETARADTEASRGILYKSSKVEGEGGR